MLTIVINHYKGKSVVFKNCETNATLKGLYQVGGLAGINTMQSLFVDQCKTAGTIWGPDAVSRVGGIAGAVSAQQTLKNEDNSILFAATDCTLAATVNGGVMGAVYGWQNPNANKERIYIRDCGGQETPSRNVGDFTDFSDATDYVWLIDSAEDLALIGNADSVNTSYTYPLNGFYRLAQDVDMGGATRSAPVVDAVFRGVFDGNGNAVSGLVMNCKLVDTGFFKALAGDSTKSYNSVLITDLKLGTKASPVEITAPNSVNTAAFVGALAAEAGKSSGDVGNSGTVINNVEAHIETVLTSNSGQTLAGGLIGNAARGYFYDCNVFGSLSAGGAAFKNATTIGGMVGQLNTTNVSMLYNCNNFADLTLSCTCTNRFHTGGMIGCTNGAGVVFLNCNNFGNITNACAGASASNSSDAGAILGRAHSSGTNAVAIGCSNFGSVSATGANSYAGVVVARLNGTATAAVSDFSQFGTKMGSDYSSAPSTLNSKSGTAIEMMTGASVRLSGETGLRFAANVSTTAIAQLEKIDGATISCGMLISPDAFITNAGAFTHDALDRYAADPVNGFGEAKAYVDVPVSDWFKGEEGRIAGSIIELPATLYNTNFSGCAYIAVEIGGTVVCRLYANNAQSRTIKGVAQAALDDVLYEKSGTLYKKDGAEYAVYNGADAATYVTEIGTDDGYTILSCYTSAELTILSGIVSAAG